MGAREEGSKVGIEGELVGGRVGVAVGGLVWPNTVGAGVGLEEGWEEGAKDLRKRLPALSAAIPATPGSGREDGERVEGGRRIER